MTGSPQAPRSASDEPPRQPAVLPQEPPAAKAWHALLRPDVELSPEFCAELNARMRADKAQRRRAPQQFRQALACAAIVFNDGNPDMHWLILLHLVCPFQFLPLNERSSDYRIHGRAKQLLCPFITLP